MIKAAIFDMDGLLIDSEPFWHKSHVEVLGKYGFVITEDDVRAMAGRRTDEVVDLWQKRFKWQDVPNNKVEQEIVSKVTELVHINGVALPGVYELIELLQKHNLPLAVASSSGPELIDAVLTHLNLKQHMTVIHSAKHEKQGKPHPDVFLSTAKKLKVDPKDCVVFEDAISGVQAAKAAGMKCVAVPEHPHDPTKFKIADVVVKSLELIDWALLEGL